MLDDKKELTKAVFIAGIIAFLALCALSFYFERRELVALAIAVISGVEWLALKREYRKRYLMKK